MSESIVEDGCHRVSDVSFWDYYPSPSKFYLTVPRNCGRTDALRQIALYEYLMSGEIPVDLLGAFRDSRDLEKWRSQIDAYKAKSKQEKR